MSVRSKSKSKSSSHDLVADLKLYLKVSKGEGRTDEEAQNN